VTTQLIFERNKTFFVPTMIASEVGYSSIEPIFIGLLEDAKGLKEAIADRLREGNKAIAASGEERADALIRAARCRSRKDFEKGAKVWEISEREGEGYRLVGYRKITSWKHGGFEPDPTYPTLQYDPTTPIDEVAESYSMRVIADARENYLS
jgi:hypothetical protein